MLRTAQNLAASGVSPLHISLPYSGAPPSTSRGMIVPGELRSQGSGAGDPLVPQGIAYYGQNDTNGTVRNTTLDVSSLVGQLQVNHLDTLYFDTDTPDVSGIQLNTILANVTLQGTTGYQYWTQNAVDYIASNSTLSFGEDTWNFSSTTASIPVGQSTILSHSPNGSVEAGVYTGFGPYVYAPQPFDLTLYLNSSVTPSNEQELWYNFTLAARGEPFRRGSYDWVVFNSTNPQHPATVALAPFQASGTTRSDIGSVPEDFELDYGIAGFNGATMDVLSANISANLTYCPADTAICSPSQFRSVPSATDYGAQTGESGSGLAFFYRGTTEYAHAGPMLPQGLWGYQGQPGSVPGMGILTNAIIVTGSPDPSATPPYMFVFFENAAVSGEGYGWAPDVPAWYLMPGQYDYVVMLSDYAEATGSIAVGSTPTSLVVDLTYSNSSGVYTPLWALNNSGLAGISGSGTGTISDPYRPFNNPPNQSCVNCGGALHGMLSDWFFDYNDYDYPSFPGLLLNGTSPYVDVDQPVSFLVYVMATGLSGHGPSYPFYLPMALYHAQHVTIRDASTVGGWPAMFPIIMLATPPGAQNPFPQADVFVWDSDSDLVMANRFVATPVVPTPGPCVGFCPTVTCSVCDPTDELMLYGGTNNTVWGNAFEDPDGALPTTSPATYAALAEAESGDLIYNNNFSVDNPAMYMAYDVYNDSCWAGYAGDCSPLILPTYEDTWNVSNQSARDVVHTVNGFALSGNVLGPRYARQGGNYWWNWGGALNPFTTLPYVNRFNYTDYVTNLPPGSTEVEASIHVGGDFAPLRLGYDEASIPRFNVTFNETGLPSRTSWSVDLNNTTARSTNTSITLEEPNGSYPFTVGSIHGYHSSPSSGSVLVKGVTVYQPIAFAVNVTPPPPKFEITFRERGLADGTNWSVRFNRTDLTSSATVNISFTAPNGTYPYSVPPVTGYSVNVSSGNVSVKGSPVEVMVGFTVSSPPTNHSSTSEARWLGLPLWEWEDGAIIAAIVVAGVLAAVAMRGRRAPPASSQNPPPARGSPP
ncbi:MAG TPA: thermopsin family protease [Thermoplasmata archaeon]|nr:thermopsin family protease [Thermoplasmata archaeon]